MHYRVFPLTVHICCDPVDSLASRVPDILLAHVCAQDNLINQKVLHRMLQALSIPVTAISVVDNGEKAVNFVIAHSTHSTRFRPLLVLMDVFMPVMDGLDATRAIRAHPSLTPLTQPYIIALTANAMHHDKQQCLEAGMDLYLAKPVTRQTLSDALDQFRTRGGKGREEQVGV